MTQPNEPVSLLPCPFCGGEARISTYETESLWSHDQVTYTKVFCDDCDVGFDTEPGHELQAAEVWNRRASTTEVMLAELVEACRPFAEKAQRWDETLGAGRRDSVQIEHRIGDFRRIRDILDRKSCAEGEGQ